MIEQLIRIEAERRTEAAARAFEDSLRVIPSLTDNQRRAIAVAANAYATECVQITASASSALVAAVLAE